MSRSVMHAVSYSNVHADSSVDGAVNRGLYINDLHGSSEVGVVIPSVSSNPEKGDCSNDS